jgi:hypothetical protein
VSGSASLAGLADTNVEHSKTDGDLLVSEYGAWKAAAPPSKRSAVFTGLEGVDIANPRNNQFVSYADGAWRTGTPPTVALQGLSDVSVSAAPADGDLLVWDAATSSWQNKPFAGARVPIPLGAVGGVDVAAAAAGDVLVYDGVAAWKAQAPPDRLLADLADVSIAAPVDGQVLMRSAAGLWGNHAAPSAPQPSLARSIADVSIAAPRDGFIIARDGRNWVARAPIIPTIDSLSDASIAGQVAQGDLLVYKQGAWRAAPYAYTVYDQLGQLGDVALGAPTAGRALRYSASQAAFVDAPVPLFALGEYPDVEIDAPLEGQALIYDGSLWRNQPAPAADPVFVLDECADVTVSGPLVEGQALVYDGTFWRNAELQAGTLGALSDVALSPPTDGDLLVWDGARFSNAAFAYPARAIASLTDARQPGHDDVLVYSGGKWVNAALPAAPSYAVTNLTDANIPGIRPIGAALTYENSKWTLKSAPAGPVNALEALSDVAINNPKSSNHVLTYRSGAWTNEYPPTYSLDALSDSDLSLKTPGALLRYDGAVWAPHVIPAVSENSDGLYPVSNLSALVAPAPTDNANQKYERGSLWMQANDALFVCSESTTSTATWLSAFAGTASHGTLDFTDSEFLNSRTAWKPFQTNMALDATQSTPDMKVYTTPLAPQAMGVLVPKTGLYSVSVYVHYQYSTNSRYANDNAYTTVAFATANSDLSLRSSYLQDTSHTRSTAFGKNVHSTIYGTVRLHKDDVVALFGKTTNTESTHTNVVGSLALTFLMN